MESGTFWFNLLYKECTNSSFCRWEEELNHRFLAPNSCQPAPHPKALSSLFSVFCYRGSVQAVSCFLVSDSLSVPKQYPATPISPHRLNSWVDSHISVLGSDMLTCLIYLKWKAAIKSITFIYIPLSSINRLQLQWNKSVRSTHDIGQ